MSNSELVLVQLKRLRTLHHQRRREEAPARSVRLGLSRWQSERLERTHADLLSDPRYRPAVEFFFSDVYSARDMSRRDAELERVAPTLVRVLPDGVVETLAHALEMNALTQELDARLASVLRDLGQELDEELYAEGCRRADDYPERLRQVELIRLVGEDLDRVVHKPFLKTALLLARAPVHAAGLGRLMDATERGRDAFAHMGEAGYFLRTIVGRETKILERIFAGDPRPFEVGA